jgi:hypothetical protein
MFFEVANKITSGHNYCVHTKCERMGLAVQKTTFPNLNSVEDLFVNTFRCDIFQTRRLHLYSYVAAASSQMSFLGFKERKKTGSYHKKSALAD